MMRPELCKVGWDFELLLGSLAGHSPWLCSTEIGF